MQSETGNSISDMWDEIKTLVGDVDLDVMKNARGVSAAGVRARKGLRIIKSKMTDLVKVTIDTDKAKKVARGPRKKKS